MNNVNEILINFYIAGALVTIAILLLVIYKK